MKNSVKYFMWILIWWAMFSSYSFASWVCPSENEVFTRWNYELKLVEVENNNSNFIKKVLQEYKTNFDNLKRKNKELKNIFDNLITSVEWWKYWDKNIFNSNTIYTAKKDQLDSNLSNFETLQWIYLNKYLKLDYLTKLRNWDNDEYIQTTWIYVQSRSWTTVTKNYISCIKNDLVNSIEWEYKKLEVLNNVSNSLLNDIKWIVEKWNNIQHQNNNSKLQNMYNEILSDFSASWIAWWTELHKKEFLKLDWDKNTYINSNINYLCNLQWKEFLDWMIVWKTSDTKCYLWIPSIKEIPAENFNLIKNTFWTSYWFLKFKLNSFKENTLTFWWNTIQLDKWSSYIIIYFSQDEQKFKLWYFDEKWRELNNFDFDITDDLIFSDYVWISSLNSRTILWQTSNQFKNSIRQYFELMKVDNWNLSDWNWNINNIFKTSYKSLWEINNKLIQSENKKLQNWFTNIWKISVKDVESKKKKYTINISPSLLRYFKIDAFENIEDISKLLNLEWTFDQLWDLSNSDWFIELLTKTFDWQTILWWSWDLNTWSLYENSNWNRINFTRNLQNWWISIDWSLKEYWFLDPKFQWDNNWKKYARWMIVSMWKMISNKQNWWDLYLFPLIDQDWWTMLNIWNLTKTFNETSKIWSCWKTSYTCWWFRIEQWKEYKQQDITNFISEASRDFWKPWCDVSTEEEYKCLTKKIDSPTTLMIWDNRKWLQDVLMYKFTVDLTQQRIEDAIQYKFITSVPQYWKQILKIRRWKTDNSWNKIIYYIKSIQDAEEMKFVKDNFNWKYLTNLIVTTNFDDFDKDNTDNKKKNWLKQTATWLLTKEQLISFFWISI